MYSTISWKSDYIYELQYTNKDIIGWKKRVLQQESRDVLCWQNIKFCWLKSIRCWILLITIRNFLIDEI